MRKKKDTHSFDFRPLGLAIREAREKAGLSRNDLGDKVFYGERHIADIENIGKHPSFQLFHDLVTMFNISVDEYFYPAKNVEKNTARRQIDSSESFCQGGAWIFFILLTQILSLLLPE